MTLAQFLQSQRTTQADFAKAVGITQTAVHRYISGSRVPRPAIMRRIIAATGGQVQANDFFIADALRTTQCRFSRTPSIGRRNPKSNRIAPR